MLTYLMTWSLTQTCLIGGIVWLLVYWYLQNKKYNMPPGPWRLPILGNALQLISDKRHHIKFYEWSKKYGPVITVGLGPIKLVVVNNIDTALEVLVKKSTEYAGRMTTPAIGRFTDNFKDIAFAKYGHTWKLQRKVTAKAFRNYMQGHALERRIHESLKTVFEVLDKYNKPFSPREAIDLLVTNIHMGLCFNKKFEYGDKEMEELIENRDEVTLGFNVFIIEDLLPPLQYVYKSAAMKRVEDLTQKLVYDFIGRRFHKEKSTFNKENIRHLTDALIQARDEANEDGQQILTDAYLVQIMCDIFFASTDTFRITLYFAILHMLAFPDIQTKVQEELDREVGLDRLPCLADRPNLSYTEAVLHESMRLATMAPSGLLHSTLVDTGIYGHVTFAVAVINPIKGDYRKEFAGYRLPKGTLVMINHWALHHDPQAWDDVDRFIPERFLDGNGKLGPKPQNWLPFSAGKRVCVGEFVAKPQLHLVFAGLMQKFTWRAESGVCLDLEPQGTLFSVTHRPYNVIVSLRPETK